MQECPDGAAPENETPPFVAEPGDGLSPRLTNPTVSLSDNSSRPCTAPDGFPRSWDDQAYLFSQEIGRGGSGVVWRAVHVALNRVVAIKTVRQRGSSDGVGSTGGWQLAHSRFYEEALIMARLDHPNIAPIYGVARMEDGTPLLAMKLVEGRPWSEVMKRDFHRLSPHDFLQEHLPILTQMMQAVAFAHSRGVIHRDLKPSQVMLGEFGEVVLLDWGLAILGGEADRPASNIAPLENGVRLPDASTATNPAGTPALMAPEQTRPTALDITPRTDVYLLGGTLYSLLTGTYPHDAKTVAESMYRAAQGVVEHPQKRRPERHIPPELAAIAMRALEARPEDRYPSVKEFLAAVEEYMGGVAQRRESIALTREATAALEDLARHGLKFVQLSPTDFEIRMTTQAPDLGQLYPVIEEARLKVEQATQAWNENPELPRLRDAVAAATSLTAALTGDLRLARYVGKQVRATSARMQLTDQIEKREASNARHDAMLRRTILSVGVLLFMITLGAVKYSFEQSYSKARLELERNEADAARAEATAQREVAEAALALAREEQYFATMHLVANAHKQGDMARVRSLLLNADAPHRHFEWGHMWHLALPDRMSLSQTIGDHALLSAAFSPDGSVVYVGDQSGGLARHDFATGRWLDGRRPHRDGISSITPSPDGRWLLTTSLDRTAAIVHADTLMVVHRLEGHVDVLRGGAISPDGRLALTTSLDRTIRYWDMATGQHLRTLAHDGVGGHAVAFSPDGTRFASTHGPRVLVHEAATGSVLAEAPEHPENVLGLEWSPDGARLLTAGTDRVARVFRVDRMEEVLRLENRTSWLHSARWSPDGSLIATGGNDGVARLWDADSGALLGVFPGQSRAHEVRFSPDGAWLMTTANHAVQVWDPLAPPTASGLVDLMPTLLPANTRPTMAAHVHGAPMEPTWLGHDRIFHQSDGRAFYQWEGVTVAVDSFYTSHDPTSPRAIIVQYPWATAVILDTDTGQVVAPWPHQDLYMARWSPDGDSIAVITTDGEFLLFDAETLEQRAELGEPSPIHGVASARIIGTIAFDPTSQRIFTGRRNGEADLWNAQSGAHLQRLPTDGSGIACAAFSPDGSLVAAGTAPTRARVWSTADGKLVSTLSGHQDTIIGISFHPDNRRVATTGTDDVKLWDTLSGREVMTVLAPADSRVLLGTAFTPGGRQLMAMDSTGMIHLADTMAWTDEQDHAAVMQAMELEKRHRTNPSIQPRDVHVATAPPPFDEP